MKTTTSTPAPTLALAAFAVAALCTVSLATAFARETDGASACAGGGERDAAAPNRVRVEPAESDALLANPGMGWQTFHRFADEDPNLRGLPSASAYFRFYWKELEPREGEIDFARFDRLLERARGAGQRLAFRVMCAGTGGEYAYVPPWLKKKGCRGFEYRYGGKGPLHWIPDMDDPLFLEAHLRLISRLGKRYDGRRDLDLVDLGSVGHWGEWHMSRTEVPLPSPETRAAIIDAYCKAFPRTPLVMLIGDEAGMRRAVAKGCGWRADCLGDMGGFSPTWCHMKDFYPGQVEKTGARDAWKRGPVAFETCWDMRKWVGEGWDVRAIFDFALAYHASYVNDKSAPIPEGSRAEVERLLRRLGYRLVLKRLEHDRAAKAGSAISLSTVWENEGVAPPYLDDRVAFRLRLAGAPRSRARVLGGRTSIRGWLPGRIERRESVTLPRDLAPGRYELAVAVVDPESHEPAVRLAIEGRESDGWTPLSHLEVTAP